MVRYILRFHSSPSNDEMPYKQALELVLAINTKQQKNTTYLPFAQIRREEKENTRKSKQDLPQQEMKFLSSPFL